jgi:short-chain fatty acids transporter
VLLIAIAPPKSEMRRIDPELLKRDEAGVDAPPAAANFAQRIENAPLLTLLLVAMGVFYEAVVISRSGFSLDIDGMIFIALMLGLLLHWRPIRYVSSFNRAARTVGPILLQFPLYGGIMGMMTGTGLAAVIATGFVSFSTHQSLPFWSFVSSNIISLFVPSGGGHWAVQGPFMVPAAVTLKVDPAMTAMATAMGEQTANMIQPFWALPVLAIAGLGIRDIMGYCVMALLLGLVLYGGALLLFA